MLNFRSLQPSPTNGMSLAIRDLVIFLTNHLHTIGTYNVYMTNTGYSSGGGVTIIDDLTGQEIQDFTTDLRANHVCCLDGEIVQRMMNLSPTPKTIDSLTEGELGMVTINTIYESHYALCCVSEGNVYLTNLYGGVHQARLVVMKRELFVASFARMCNTQDTEEYGSLFYKLTGFNSLPVKEGNADRVVEVGVGCCRIWDVGLMMIRMRGYLVTVVKGFIDARGVENEAEQFWELVDSIDGLLD